MPPKRATKKQKADEESEEVIQPRKSARAKKDEKAETKQSAAATKASAASSSKPKGKTPAPKKPVTSSSDSSSISPPPKAGQKKGGKKPAPRSKSQPQPDDKVKASDSTRQRGRDKTKASDADVADSKVDKKKPSKPEPKPDRKAAPRKTSSKKKSPSPSPVKKAKVDEEPKNLKKLVVTGTAPVDEYVPSREDYKVFEESGQIYDLMMNQTNIAGGNNNNKFYIVQILQNKAGNFYVWNRWGRVGVEGQHVMKPFFSNKEGAIRDYNHKKHEKSVKGDYRVLERDYNFQDPAATQEKEDKAFDKSKLPPKIKELVRMIFDMKMINTQMKEIGYDADKMPLGKLAASTIKKGFDVLKQISEELKSAKKSQTRLEQLTSEFYSQIPHDFGFMRAPIIDTDKKVKEKLEMLESIQHIQVATKILEGQKDSDANIIDSNYEKLQTNITYLEPTSEKAKLIKEYIKNTHAATHSNYSLDVFDVYELQKDLDDKRFKKELGNRMLLWHGSRLTNFVGILSQGLRIAPPEAPVTGYMFGKGVYFADMVSKSANYCGTSKDNNVGCILLADVALGNTNEKFYADYNASNLPAGKHSTHAKGRTAPAEKSYVPMIDMPEVKVPIGKGEPSGITNTSLLYNEYIVYDVAQVRLKYLIKMKWNYK